MAFIRFAEDSLLDAEAVEFITGNYYSKDPSLWKTDLIINGVTMTIDGQPGRNVMDAVIWHRRSNITDMIPGENYKKKLY